MVSRDRLHGLRLRRLLPVACAAIAVAMIAAESASGAALKVCPGGPPTCQFASIQAALDAASDGDKIVIAAGTYSGLIRLQKSVKLRGAGSGQTTLTVVGASSVIVVEPGVSVKISGVTVTGGGFGSAVVNSGTLAVKESAVSGNSAFGCGGGILNDTGAMLTLKNSTVTGNFAVCGAGIFNSGTATLKGSAVSENQAHRGIGPGQGGGIFNAGSGTLTLRNTTVTGNTADDDGGGIFNAGGSVTLEKSLVSANSPNDCVGVTC